MNNRDYNLHVLQNKLTEAFINYQWRLENPMPPVSETYEIRITQYLCNSIFHKKVERLTASVMDIVTKWLETTDDL